MVLRRGGGRAGAGVGEGTGGIARRQGRRWQNQREHARVSCRQSKWGMEAHSRVVVFAIGNIDTERYNVSGLGDDVSGRTCNI